MVTCNTTASCDLSSVDNGTKRLRRGIFAKKISHITLNPYGSPSYLVSCNQLATEARVRLKMYALEAQTLGRFRNLLRRAVVSVTGKVRAKR
jgi:hypothetical protein